MAENDIKVSELPSGTVEATSAFYMAKSDNSYQASGADIADYSVASKTQTGLNNKTPVAAINSAISNTTDAFDDTASYAVGDLCIYENALYRFTTAKSAGAWDSTKVTATTLDAEKMRHIKDLLAGSDYSPAITPSSSHYLPISDGTNEYKASVGDILSINAPVVYTDTFPTVECASATVVTLASLTVPKGIYIVSAYHEWQGSSAAKYQDYLVYDQAYRNLTMIDGGGVYMSTIVSYSGGTNTINYKTYQYGSSSATAKNISLIAVKIG